MSLSDSELLDELESSELSDTLRLRPPLAVDSEAELLGDEELPDDLLSVPLMELIGECPPEAAGVCG